MTNYEKIKSMSIDELIEYIIGSICLSCIYITENCDCKKFNCRKGIKQWLESEE